MKAKDPNLTAAQVRSLLNYDPATGIFRWRVKPCQRLQVGAIAGSRHSVGYWNIKIEGKLVMAHRLAWLITYGRWPANQLDHINGKRNDNRIDNLRECTRAENYQNKCLYKNNTSSYPGVNQVHENKWRARIRLDGKLRHLGYFSTPEKAYQAYVLAKRELHPYGTL